MNETLWVYEVILYMALSNMQGDSWLMDITADNFLGFCDQKCHINMSPILDGYRVMAA